MVSTGGIDWTTAGPLAAAFVGGGVAFVKEWVVPGKAYHRELKRSRDVSKQLEALQAAMQEDFLPAFRESTEALRKVTPLLHPPDGSVGSGGGG